MLTIREDHNIQVEFVENNTVVISCKNQTDFSETGDVTAKALRKLGLNDAEIDDLLDEFIHAVQLKVLFRLIKDQQ